MAADTSPGCTRRGSSRWSEPSGAAPGVHPAAAPGLSPGAAGVVRTGVDQHRPTAPTDEHVPAPPSDPALLDPALSDPALSDPALTDKVRVWQCESPLRPILHHIVRIRSRPAGVVRSPDPMSARRGPDEGLTPLPGRPRQRQTAAAQRLPGHHRNRTRPACSHAVAATGVPFALLTARPKPATMQRFHGPYFSGGCEMKLLVRRSRLGHQICSVRAPKNSNLADGRRLGLTGPGAARHVGRAGRQARPCRLPTLTSCPPATPVAAAPRRHRS